LLLSILAASGAGAGAIGHGIAEFVLQMVVGLAVGLVGGVALLEFMRRVPLPNAALYPLRTLACGMALYGLAAVAHGSGFLAVFTAGILIGDARAPYKMEIERFHSAVASFGEIVAFVVLGFTVHLDSLTKHNTWAIGLALAALLTFVVRPVLVGALLLPIRLRRGEKAFILWAGLKGAVPILLGTFIIAENVSDRTRLYGLIFIVVAFSVVVQGSMVPTVAHAMGVPMRTVEPEPWTAGVRLRDEPENLHRYVVAAESVADGTTIADLPGEDDIWISLVTRDGRLVPIRGSTELRAGDEVLAIVSPERADEQARLFRRQ
jgi:cell volume regulation protein A